MAVTWSKIGSRSIKAAGCAGTEAAPAVPVKATNTVAFSAAAATNTVTIRDVAFTAIANGATPADSTQFAVGAGDSADTDTGAAFADAVNANRGRLGMTAVNASGTVTLTADEYGTYANAWTVVKSGDPITLGGATFSGGVDIVGVPLEDVSQVIVAIEAAATKTVVNGSIFAYWLNPWTMLWSRVPGLDVAIGAVTYRCVAGTPSAAICGTGWLAYLPSGTTISAGTADVYVTALTRNSVGSATRV